MIIIHYRDRIQPESNQVFLKFWFIKIKGRHTLNRILLSRSVMILHDMWFSIETTSKSGYSINYIYNYLY
jgi:hypothetical protein